MPVLLPGQAIPLPDKVKKARCPNCKRKFAEFLVVRDSHTKKVKRLCPFCHYQIRTIETKEE
jgi:hypothetical protein